MGSLIQGMPSSNNQMRPDHCSADSDRTVWLWLNAEPASGNMLFHESLHAADYSSDTEWEKAISADAFVADPYAKMSNAEVSEAPARFALSANTAIDRPLHKLVSS